MKLLADSVQIQTFSKGQEYEKLHSISDRRKMPEPDLLEEDTEKCVILHEEANSPSLEEQGT